MSRLLLVALAVAVASGPSGAQGPAKGGAVPPDAAVFVHGNVAKLWKGPIGEQVRAAKVEEIDRVVREFEAVTGLTPADVTSASVYFPDLRMPGGQEVQPFVVTLALAKPIDAGRLVALAAVGCRASDDKVSYTYAKDVLTLKVPTVNRRTATVVGAAEQKAKFNEIVLDMTDARCPRLSVMVPAGAKASKAATGPLTPAILAAAKRDLVVGINYDGLPPEIRTSAENSPAEMRPFVPFIKADLALVVGDFASEKIALEARFRSTDAAVTRDCEKSLGALQTLLATVVEAGLRNAAKSKDPGEKLLGPVLESLKTSVNAAAIRIDGSDAVASLAIRTDVPFGPALAAAFGKSVGNARDRAVGQNNLKQLGLAMHNYESANAHFPPPAVTGKKGKPLLSWRVAVLPYVEQDNLMRQFKMDEAWDSEHNLKVLKDNPMPAVFALPGVTKEGDKETFYRVFVGNGAAFEPLKNLTFPGSFTDGTSNTLLIATAATSVPWTKPDELAFDPRATAEELKKLLRMDGDGCNVVFADGSVRFLRSTIDVANLKGIITRSGGEVLNLD